MKDLTLSALKQIAGGATSIGAFDFTATYGTASVLTAAIQQENAAAMTQAVTTTLTQPNLNVLIVQAGDLGVGSDTPVNEMSMQFV